MTQTKLMVLASAVMLLGGCAMTPGAPVDRRVTLSPEVGYDVCVTDIRCCKGTGDYFTFQANVANNTGSPYPIQWKVQWLDAEGLEIDSLVSSWDSLMLQPFEVRALKGTAPRPEAVDLRFYARRGK